MVRLQLLALSHQLNNFYKKLNAESYIIQIDTINQKIQ